MQVINDMVLFLSCYSFILPLQKFDTPGSRRGVQGLKGLQMKSHFPLTLHIFGSNDDNVKKSSLSQRAFLRHSEME